MSTAIPSRRLSRNARANLERETLPSSSAARQRTLYSPSDREYLLDLSALGWDAGTLVYHAHCRAPVFDTADSEDTPPVWPANEACAFSFACTTAKSKAEFSINVEDAGAGAAPCDVLGLGLPRNQNKRNDGCKMSRCPSPNRLRCLSHLWIIHQRYQSQREKMKIINSTTASTAGPRHPQ